MLISKIKKEEKRKVIFSFLFLLSCLVLSSCGQATATPAPLAVIKIHASPLAQTWLSESYECAPSSAVIRLSDSQSDADIRFQIGEGADKFAYQIDSEDILVIVNKINPFARLTQDQVRALFSGEITDWAQIDSSKTGAVQVWGYSSDETVQSIFEDALLAGAPITSLARIATSPDEMSAAIANDVNAIGILPRRWKTGDTSEMYSIPSIPVLALTPREPQDSVKELIACLQK